MKTLEQIQKTYHDALFFASAPSNKKEKFYLSPSEFKVIIKLMMHQRSNPIITYQNKDIAKHCYLAETTVKDAMERLASIGFIKSEVDRYNNGYGNKSKRKVTINWDFIIEVDAKINQTEKAPESTIPTQSIPEVQVEEKVSQIEEKPSQIETYDVTTPSYIKYKNKWDNDRKRFDYSELTCFDKRFKQENTGIGKFQFRKFVEMIREDENLSFEDFLIMSNNYVIQIQNS